MRALSARASLPLVMFGLLIDYRGRLWRKTHGQPLPWGASGHWAGGFVCGHYATLVRPHDGRGGLDLD